MCLHKSQVSGCQGVKQSPTTRVGKKQAARRASASAIPLPSVLYLACALRSTSWLASSIHARSPDYAAQHDQLRLSAGVLLSPHESVKSEPPVTAYLRMYFFVATGSQPKRPTRGRRLFRRHGRICRAEEEPTCRVLGGADRWPAMWHLV